MHSLCRTKLDAKINILFLLLIYQNDLLKVKQSGLICKYAFKKWGQFDEPKNITNLICCKVSVGIL